MSFLNLNSRYPWLFVLLFAVGATGKYDLAFVVRVPLSEIIAFGAIPFLLRGVPWSRFAQRMRTVLLLLGLWVLGIIVADFVNTFVLSLFIRDLAKPIWCFLWLLFFIGVLCKDPRALLWYPAGAVLASLQNYFFPQAWTADRLQAGGYDFVAYGLTPIFTALALFLAVLVYQKSRLLVAFVMLAVATILLAVDAPRSSTALYLLSALIFTYLAWANRGKGVAPRLSRFQLAGLAALFVLAGICIFEVYAYSAAEGWLGEFQQQKLLTQSKTIYGSNILGLLLSGRTQVFGAILAIIDNPLLGYGSGTGPMLTEYFYAAVAYVGTDASELSRLAAMGGGFAPGHSILFATWMENGLLAAIAVAGIGVIILGDLIVVLQSPKSRLVPLLIILGTFFGWSFFFSPFGVSSRFVIGLFLALYVMSFHRAELFPRRRTD